MLEREVDRPFYVNAGIDAGAGVDARICERMLQQGSTPRGEELVMRMNMTTTTVAMMVMMITVAVTVTRVLGRRKGVPCVLNPLFAAATSSELLLCIVVLHIIKTHYDKHITDNECIYHGQGMEGSGG